MNLIDITNISLGQMWLLVVVMTVATCLLFNLYWWDNIKLGVKALMTWNKDEVSKLHKEHGTSKTILWTFAMYFVGTHLMFLMLVWIGVVLWTLGIWNPHL